MNMRFFAFAALILLLCSSTFKADNSNARKEAEELRQQVKQLVKANEELSSENSELETQNKKLVSENDNLNRHYARKWHKYKHLREIVGCFGGAYEAEVEAEEEEDDAPLNVFVQRMKEEEYKDFFAMVIAADIARINRDVLPLKVSVESLTVHSLLREIEKAISKLKWQLLEAQLERDNYKVRWKDEKQAKNVILAKLDKYKSKFGDLD